MYAVYISSKKLWQNYFQTDYITSDNICYI
jgi:hypothetical protein